MHRGEFEAKSNQSLIIVLCWNPFISLAQYFLSPGLLISFFSSNSVLWSCGGQMEACDFRHTQIKSLSVSVSFPFSLSLGKLGKILEFPSLPSLFLSLSLLLHYSQFHRQQMLEGVRSWNIQTTRFLIVHCSDWFTFFVHWYTEVQWPTYIKSSHVYPLRQESLKLFRFFETYAYVVIGHHIT